MDRRVRRTKHPRLENNIKGNTIYINIREKGKLDPENEKKAN